MGFKSDNFVIHALDKSPHLSVLPAGPVGPNLQVWQGKLAESWLEQHLVQVIDGASLVLPADHRVRASTLENSHLYFSQSQIS